jgi:hypothetical protein
MVDSPPWSLVIGHRSSVPAPRETTKVRGVISDVPIVPFRASYSGAFSALTRSRFFKVRSTTSAESVDAVATTAIAKV